MFNQNVNSELYFIYGLIAVVVVLIIIVIVIDRKETKRCRRKVKLTDTLNMKPITDDMLRDSSYEEDIETISMLEDEDTDTKSIPKLKINLGDIKDDYQEEELDKTQAQIRVEEITKALKDANIDEEIEKDKYSKYEDDQEKNAIISYEELKNSYDKLYEESEKNQYVDDNTIPINIKELYDLGEQIKEENVNYTKNEKISNTDKDIESANKFLNTLRELRQSL